MKKNKIKKYFNKSLGSEWLLLAIFGCILNIVSQIQNNSTLNIFSIILIVAGIVLFIKDTLNFAKRMDSYCQGLSETFHDLKKQELSSIDIAFDLTMENYIYENPFKIRKARRGSDGKWRSSAYETCILFFSESKIYCYEQKKSLISNELNFSNLELTPTDISAVSVEQQNNNFFVSVIIFGNRTLNFQCSSPEKALSLSEKIKTFIK